MSNNWELVKDKLGGLPYFSNADVGQILDKDESYVKQILLRYEKAQKVMRIKRGYYMTREFFLSNKNNFEFGDMVASIVAPNGYLSTEYILQRHGVMTEAVYAYTGMTSSKTQQLHNKFGNYIFRHIKPAFYGGFETKDCWGVKVRIATVGKALFDYLYIRPHGWTYGEKKYDLVEDLRLNLYDWEEKDKINFENWIVKSGSTKMRNALVNIKRSTWTS